MTEPLRVCFVCTGNICRSPMAEVVLRSMLRDAGLDGLVAVESCGTSAWHVGDRADPRAVRALAAAGYDGAGHRARVFERRWFASRDLLVALDRGHLGELRALSGSAEDTAKVRLLRSFDPAGGELDVPDPYYGDAGDFTATLALVEAACEGLLAEVQARLGRIS